MAPKKGKQTSDATPSGGSGMINQEDLALIVAEQISDAIPNIVAQVHADSNTENGNGTPKEMVALATNLVGEAAP
jgi:hypothetical protein